MVSVEIDKKGGAYIVSHMRCGYHECIWLIKQELTELKKVLNELLLE